jgi:hypothetical protein
MEGKRTKSFAQDVFKQGRVAEGREIYRGLFKYSLFKGLCQIALPTKKGPNDWMYLAVCSVLRIS